MSLRVLGIHGLGKHDPGTWEQSWEDAIRDAIPNADSLGVDFRPFNYDEIYEQIDISAWEGLRAFAKLAGGGIVSGVGGLLGTRGAARGVLDSTRKFLNWYAGYVVAWLEDEDFRATIRSKLLAKISDEKPDIILAHSLGSLISYDALSDESAWRRSSILRRQIPKLRYVTLGSQIGNIFVRRNLTPGRIAPLSVKHWYHLFNSEDDVFTEEIRLQNVPNFQQVDTFFDIDGWLDHDAVEYLKHPLTIENLWSPISLELSKNKSAKSMARSLREVAKPAAAERPPRRRALLIGINDYPNPADRLAGCINDVYLMSAVLQECGFAAEQIRIVLNDRATAAGILDRFDWLLRDARAGDELVFYFSGHGAQLPTYGAGDSADRMDETLVPYDFDWSPDTCVTDDVICDLYSQLPWDTRFCMIVDACHSGGIHRDSGLVVRGLTAPDDIRHRAMRWDETAEMWVARALPPLNEDFSDDPDTIRRFCGTSNSTLRLGRSMLLRGQTQGEYEASKKQSDDPVGPYLPMILEACREDQFAYEYRHGVESYGAFTFTLTKLLRQRKTLTFRDAVTGTRERLAQLGYEQEPAILGPSKLIDATIPWKSRRRRRK